MRVGATSKGRLAISLVVIALAAAGIVGASRMLVQHASSTETSRAAKSDPTRFTPTPAQWASLSVEAVTERVFRAEHVTEGKIAVNEDSSTPIFSPYAGRVVKL